MDKEIIELRRELHAHPELSCHEDNTKKTLMRFIKEHTNLAIFDKDTWFYTLKKASKKSDIPGIAFRADFDALPINETLPLSYCSTTPGVSHKCGHDGHAASLCGLAIALDQKDVQRDVYLIFQPAEEIGRGGKPCADFVKEQNISEVYAFHNRSGYPENTIVAKEGLMQCASVGLVVTFHGKTSHASEPELGINPSHAIATLLDFTYALSPENFSDFTLCTVIGVSMGDRNFGISPGDGEACYTLRANCDEDLALLERMIKEKASYVAAESNMNVTFEVYDPFPATVSTPVCARKVRRCAEQNGLSFLPMDSPWRASEDFGWYTKACPGAMFYIGDGEDYPALHTKEFDFNDRIMDTAVRMFLSLIEEPLN